VLYPPGLDEQWLVSVAHTDEDLARGLDVLREFVEALTQSTV
jgi:glutamate-1-semialdehyde 2,1-aminomutase